MSTDTIDLDHLTENDTRYDEIFLSVLQSQGKIEPFIDCFFKFLYRRTDFFLIQETAQQPYGFPAGIAEQIVSKTFKKYDDLCKDKLKKKLLESNDEITKKIPKQAVSNKKSNQSLNSVGAKPLTSENECIDLKKKQEIFQANSSSYNGAIRDQYSWSQTIKDLDVQVKINSSVKSSKDVKIKIEKSSLHVASRDSCGVWTDLIRDSLSWKIKPDECTWSLLPGDHIHIYLEKTEERWWEKLLDKEEKLDIKNMNPEKPIEDLEPEAQAKIKQLMYDEQQKRLGLPTSEQQQYQDVLKKAWNIEGSPFKGTPFDPSIIKSPNELDMMNQMNQEDIPK